MSMMVIRGADVDAAPPLAPGVRVPGSREAVQSLRSGYRVKGAGFRVQGSGCRVQGLGFRVQGVGCQV